ncbi:hypothetical protein [Actinoplanes sp. NBRC 101535]|uniref:hypothetical protein n=1 Tax=Actinoplanes sp. NBRC 101535 TaxID=3032196 RepID=UPI0024A4B597|nr:hypothetical protein [Actinoplanes sp. NBRC 101535]GLY03767.1 hypothetical protein Acsp01_41460 [Actinoplanes sp. NBRC 101535]
MINAQEILAETDWAGLEHGHGPAGDVPERLRALLSEDAAQVDAAITFLHHTLLFEQLVHSATLPAARYVAGVLTDSRTAFVFTETGEDTPQPVRWSLLNWLDRVAAAILLNDEGENPEADDARPHLIELYPAVAGRFTDDLPGVRVMARMTALTMLDADLPEFTALRSAAVPSLTAEPELLSEDEREVLAILLEEWQEAEKLDALLAGSESWLSRTIKRFRGRP